MELIERIRNNGSVLVWKCPHCSNEHRIKCDYDSIEEFVQSDPHNPDEDLFICSKCSYVAHLFKERRATIETPTETIDVIIQSEECNVFKIIEENTGDYVLIQDLQ